MHSVTNVSSFFYNINRFKNTVFKDWEVGLIHNLLDRKDCEIYELKWNWMRKKNFLFIEIRDAYLA